VTLVSKGYNNGDQAQLGRDIAHAMRTQKSIVTIILEYQYDVSMKQMESLEAGASTDCIFQFEETPKGNPDFIIKPRIIFERLLTMGPLVESAVTGRG